MKGLTWFAFILVVVTAENNVTENSTDDGLIEAWNLGEYCAINGVIRYKGDNCVEPDGLIEAWNLGEYCAINGVIRYKGDNCVEPETTSTTTSDATTTLSTPIPRAGTTVFRDDFYCYDVNKWEWDYEVSMYGGYNWELQVYTNDPLNVFQKNGHLFLKPTLTADKFGEDFLTEGVMDLETIWGACTNDANYGCNREGQYGLLPPVMSGKVMSKRTIKFGHVEVRARTPCGDWLWPALWMSPRTSKYGDWPRSGEIDLMESRGNSMASDGSINHGNQAVSSAMHWGPDAGQNKYTLTYGERRGTAYCQAFHTYTLDWTVDRIVTSVDGNVIMNVDIGPGGFWKKGGFSGDNLWASGTNAAPFDQPFYLIMNVAVGTTNGYFPDGWQYNSPKPWSNTSPTSSQDFWDNKGDWLPSWQGDSVAMEIDYIDMKQY